MLAITVQVNNPVTAQMQAFDRAAEQNLKEVVGRSAVSHIRSHFEKLDAERPNKLGGKRTHFYGQAARGTTMQIVPDGVKVSVNQVGIRLRYQGGVVRAGANPSRITGQPTKHLTIPATAASYGHTAGDFPNLVPVFSRRGGSLRMVALGLPQTVTPSAKGKNRVVVMFWTPEKTIHGPDPSVLPNEQELVAKINVDIEEYFSLILLRGGRS